MKKTTILTLAVMLFAGIAFAKEGDLRQKTFDSSDLWGNDAQYRRIGIGANDTPSLAKHATATRVRTSNAIDLNGTRGNFGLQLTVDNGSTQWDLLVSADGTTYEIPQGYSAILTGITELSGPDSDGSLFTQFTVPVAMYMKLRITESDNEPVNFTSTLVVQ